MKKACGLLLLLLFLRIPTPLFAQTATFTSQIIDSSNSGDDKAVADIDMDGRADGVLGGSSLVWYSGGENFAKHTIRSGVIFEQYTTNMAVGDVDGDGDTDVIAPDGAGQGNVLWFENPKLSPPSGKTSDPKIEANWVQHTVGTHGSYAHTVEAGDLNGDGRADIVTSGNGSGHVWLFQGKDSFRNIDITAQSNAGVRPADINRDGKLDLVFSSGWLQNNGDGSSFTTHSVNGFQGEEVGAGDLNGDGKLDIIGSSNAHERGTVSVFFAPTDPTSSTWTSKVLDANMCSHRPVVTDFNNDGRNDVLLGCELKETSVYMNQGNNTFQKTQIDTKSGHNAAVGDLNGDGKPDIFASDYIDNPPVKVYINTMSGGTPPTPTPGGASVTPGGGTTTWDKWKYIHADSTRQGTQNLWGMGMGDIDGDGDGDIVAGSYYYLNPGGTMESAWVRKTGLSDGNLVENLDGDKFGDVIDLGGSPRWLEWDGSALSVQASGNGPAGAQGAVVGDVIAGGTKEIVYSSSGVGIVLAQINGSTINTSVISTGNVADEGVDLGDFNGDGKLDVAASDGNNSIWFENNGTTSNWPRHTVGPADHGENGGGYTDKTHVADIDGDGRPDILLSEEVFTQDPIANTYWFKNPGGAATGQWERHIIATQHSTNSMSVADMDRDGDIDVITGEHYGDLEVVVWENVSKGASWVKHLVDTGKESHGGTRVFDLDGDGDLDIASIAYDKPEDLHIWRNDNTVGGGGGTCPKKPLGDANCDGKVSLADYSAWRSEFTGQLTTKTADFNTDGKVSLADYSTWRTSFTKGL
ncbi:VCBS repeat-containing protein [Candidatus Microgenomates bacterium]|nr:VCBS repeat-containing protein [Candidatus Microgenomates bacterium]